MGYDLLREIWFVICFHLFLSNYLGGVFLFFIVCSGLLYRRFFPPHFLLKYNIVAEWIFSDICHNNIVGPKFCCRMLLFPPWKWHMFLLTWKLDEPVWLT